MPNLARLLATGAVQPTLGPLGFLVGGNWPTSYTGTSPARHQFLCSGQVRGGTYEPRWIGPITDPPAVWKWVSDAGMRVCVLDAPHAAVDPSLNGVQLVEWGAHDRHAATCSTPESLLAEINEKYGPHPVGFYPAPFPHHAPCDVSHRAGVHRTPEENAQLFGDMLEGVRRKAAVSCDLLDDGDWDLFFTVFGESHCGGHQFWKMHDAAHPWHDAADVQAVGGDPLRILYGELDRALGEVLARAGDATVYVFLSHGMRAHYDGTCLLEPVLWRLEEYAMGTDRRGVFTRAVDRGADVLPRNLRGRALQGLIDARRRAQSTRGPIGTDGRPVDIPAWIGRRRWWAQPNDSVFGSIRLNVEGREPNGRIAAGQDRVVAEWLAERLYELVNVDTGTPAVRAVYWSNDVYERAPDDPLGDVLVEWHRDASISTVWSPATGVVTAPYLEWRTGDHDRRGMLLATGAGVRPGTRPAPISVVDVAPTLAASLGVDPPELAGRPIDGMARPDLLPAGAPASYVPAPIPRPLLCEQPLRPSGSRRWNAAAFEVPPAAWNEEYAVGLSQVLHAHHLALRSSRAEIDALQRRIGDLERMASIAQVGSWLRGVEVPESLLVSVVMPTRNRRPRLEQAVESVLAQTYPNWELLVVDDASSDDTWVWLEKIAASDPRVLPFHFAQHANSSRARNHALDRASGDVVVYLDDDNRFDRDWLRAVVWAFGEYPETQVLYGARVVDDDVRHQGLDGRSLPFVQFLVWDRADMLRANRVDQNTIAHRPSRVRFDETIDHFTDWDLCLQLTDECDPLELPAIAVHYHSDAPDRVTDAARATGIEPAIADHVRARARAGAVTYERARALHDRTRTASCAVRPDRPPTRTLRAASRLRADRRARAVRRPSRGVGQARRAPLAGGTLRARRVGRHRCVRLRRRTRHRGRAARRPPPPSRRASHRGRAHPEHRGDGVARGRLVDAVPRGRVAAAPVRARPLVGERRGQSRARVPPRRVDPADRAVAVDAAGRIPRPDLEQHPRRR